MTTQEAQDLAFAKLKAAWEAAAPGKEIKWPNLDQDPPGDIATPLTPDLWARVVVRHQPGTKAISARPRLHTRQFRMVVEIRAARGTGTVTLNTVSEAVLQALEENSRPWPRESRMQEVGADGAYWLYLVIVDFVYDNLH